MPRLAAALVLIGTLALGTPGCVGVSVRGLQREGVYLRLDDPVAAFTAWQTALVQDDPEAFYYALATSVRRHYPYWRIRETWDEIRGRIGTDITRSRVVVVEYLAQSPVPSRPAARVAVEYPHPKGGTVVENFLLVLELDTDEFSEAFPQWRVHFPYDAYHDQAIWFRPPEAGE